SSELRRGLADQLKVPTTRHRLPTWKSTHTAISSSETSIRTGRDRVCLASAFTRGRKFKSSPQPIYSTAFQTGTVGLVEVPEISPVVLKVSPDGRAPLIAHECGVLPPLARMMLDFARHRVPCNDSELEAIRSSTPGRQPGVLVFFDSVLKT